MKRLNKHFFKSRIVSTTILFVLLITIPSGLCHAQGLGAKTPADKSVTRIWKVGVVIKAPKKQQISNLAITFPVPTDWPEQHVNLYEEEIPREATKADFRTLDNGIRQMVAEIPRLAKNKQIELLVMMEIKVSEVAFPDRTDHLVIPKKPPRDVRLHTKPSPLINHRKAALKKQVKAIFAEHDHAWQQIEGLYDWIQANVVTVRREADTPVVGALATFQSKSGIIEDVNNLFIAMCRAGKVPCRTVWSVGGEYAEFYLQDDQGNGKWYPVVVAGRREFGKMTNPSPILQKGDNHKVPELKPRQRLVVEYLNGDSKQGARPTVRFIRNVLPSRK